MKTKALSTVVRCVCLLLVQGLGSKASDSKDLFVPNHRILNGERANPAEFRYIVRLHPARTGLCGGSIIANYYILTAGHCVIDNKCIGMEIFPSNFRPGDVPRIHAARCYKHDNYVGHGFFCDIGLIKTQQDLVGQMGLDLIPLPPPNTNHMEGTLALIAGWGMAEDGYHSNHLKKVQQQIYDWNGCNHDFQHANECTENATCPVRTIPNRSRCTVGFGRSPGGTGGGDSGGPVIINGMLVGVMAGTITNNGNIVYGAPTLYMNTVRFLPWINSYLYLGDGISRISKDNERC